MLDVLGDLFGILADFAYFETIVWAVAHDEVGTLRCLVQLLLQLGVAQAMNLYGARICLLIVEFFAEHLWKHLVDANIC